MRDQTLTGLMSAEQNHHLHSPFCSLKPEIDYYF